MIYNKYLIKEGDHFHVESFPFISDELDSFLTAISGIDGEHTSAMLIAFVRDHHLKLEWININPALSELLTSRSVNTTCLEALFDSCTQNSVFQSELESYITLKLRTSAVKF